MTPARRLLAAIGATAMILGAVALTGSAAAAAPSGSPSGSASSASPSSSPASASPGSGAPGSGAPSGAPSASPGSPGTRPSGPAASPSTSDSPTTGTGRGAAPAAAVYDMQVSAADATFSSNGPAKGVTTTFYVQVINLGTAPQHGVTVTVVEPSDAHLTGWRPDEGGITGCVHGTAPDGRGEYTCQVSDTPIHSTGVAIFDLTADLPLPANPAHPEGSVTLNGYHVPNLHPEDTAVTYAVHAYDTSKPAQRLDLRVSAKTVPMGRDSNGLYHGTLWPTVTNDGTEPVPPVTLEILPPINVTLVGPDYGCVRVGGQAAGFQSGLRCPVPALAPGHSWTLKYQLTADRPSTNHTVGRLSAYVVNDSTTYLDPNHENVATFAVTFLGTAPSASPSASGQAAGSGSSLPVTGTPLALIAGGGAGVLAAGGLLLVLARRRARAPR